MHFKGKEMTPEELTEKILGITNNSNYGWIDTDSSDAKAIENLLKEHLNKN